MLNPLSRASESVTAALALAFLMTACPLLPIAERRGVERELEVNRQVWSEQRVADYRYAVKHSCFCPEDVVAPVVVEVRDGVVVERRYQESGALAPREHRQLWPAVEGLFGVVENALERNAAEIEVGYHPRLGYPIFIRIDHDRNAVDEEQEFTVSELEPLG